MKRRVMAAAAILGTLFSLELSGQTTRPALIALQENYPKAVFYRFANNFKVKPGQEDEALRQWTWNYGQMMGAELDAARAVLATDGRAEIIQRFKKAHPEQMIILYTTGHIKVPDKESPYYDPHNGEISEYSHGHWLYLPRVRVMQDVPREPGPTTLKVQTGAAAGRRSERAAHEDYASAITKSPFSLRKDRGDDICLYSLKADGTPDWENAEQTTLIGLDEKAGTITVQRGRYGSTPRAFTGQVFAAVHCEVVKFHGWMYNFSTTCPKDKQGRTAGDVWAEIYTRLMTGSKTRHVVDALQHDTLVDQPWPERGIDIDNDGKHDDLTRGVNWFGVGLTQALQRLREKLPPEKLSMPDAGNQGYYYVNGWELEGFPGRHDPAWRDYSTGVNKLEMSRWNCAPPRYTNVQHKIFNMSLGETKNVHIMEGKELPFNLSRAVLGLTAVYEAASTWYSSPPPGPDGRAGVYDEMVMGVAKRVGWLGKPTGQPIYPGLEAPDLLAAVMPVAEKGTHIESKGTHRIVRGDDPLHETTIRYSLRSPGPELLVRLRASGVNRSMIPVKIPRAATATLIGGRHHELYLIPREEKQLEAGIIGTDGKVQPLDAGKALKQEYALGQHTLALTAGMRGAKEVYWQTTRAVPAGMHLGFWAHALGGTSYRVEAAEVVGGKPGPFKQIVEPFAPSAPICPIRRQVDLSAHGLAGKTVAFRFVSTARPSGANAHWAEVTLGKPDVGGNLPAGPVRWRIEGLVAHEPMDQFFHFNNVPVNEPLELSLEFEGGDPITIERLTAHAAGGAVARAYEHGVILVNPSPRPYVFELAKLFPGRSLRRFQATAEQDTQTNNGQPVGGSVQLGKIDGLFLVGEK